MSTTKQGHKVETKGVDSTIGFIFCGAVAGTVSRTVAAPFERLKILYQVQDLAVAQAAGQQPKYTGLMQSLIRIGKDEGLVGYFKGNGTNIIRAVPYQAAQFVSYEKFKIWMSGENKTLTTVQRLTCGGLAGVVSVLASYPLDLVRCRLSAQQADRKIYNGIWDCLKQIHAQEGVLGLYRGLWPTLLGIAPYVALNFTFFEKLKAATLDYTEASSLSITAKLVLGAFSGTAAQTAAYPLDVVRRRMQMQGYDGQGIQYKSVADAFKQIYQKYGIKGFYKGLLANWLKVPPVVSLNFIVYEQMKILLGLTHGGKEV
jgi:solute carrier family 25 phosphate transporter 23/24/25/41